MPLFQTSVLKKHRTWPCQIPVPAAHEAAGILAGVYELYGLTEEEEAPRPRGWRVKYYATIHFSASNRSDWISSGKSWSSSEDSR